MMSGTLVFMACLCQINVYVFLTDDKPIPADAPTLTPSMRIALHDLTLDRIVVAYPGDRRYALADRVEIVPLAELVGDGAGRIFRRGR
jgi:hypothetical protein